MASSYSKKYLGYDVYFSKNEQTKQAWGTSIWYDMIWSWDLDSQILQLHAHWIKLFVWCRGMWMHGPIYKYSDLRLKNLKIYLPSNPSLSVHIKSFQNFVCKFFFARLSHWFSSSSHDNRCKNKIKFQIFVTLKRYTSHPLGYLFWWCDKWCLS